MVIIHINKGHEIRRRAKLAGLYPNLIGRRFRSIRARSEALRAREAVEEMLETKPTEDTGRLTCRDPYCPNYSESAMFVCPLDHNGPESA